MLPYLVTIKRPGRDDYVVVITAGSREAAQVAALRILGDNSGSDRDYLTNLAGATATAQPGDNSDPEVMAQIQNLAKMGMMFQSNSDEEKAFTKGDTSTVKLGEPTPAGGEPNKYLDEAQDTDLPFLRGLESRGINQFGSLGSYYLNQKTPYLTAFQARQNLGWSPGQGSAEPGVDNFFQDYTAQTQNPYKDIERALANLTGQITTPGTDLTGSQPYVAPEDAQDVGTATGLFQQGLRSRIGSIGSSLAARRVGRLGNQFMALPNEQRGQTNFINYLREKLGLGNVPFRTY